MRLKPDCIICNLSIVLRTLKIISKDEEFLFRNMKKAVDSISLVNVEKFPPELGGIVYKTIIESTKVRDPYKYIKRKQNDLILKNYSNFRKSVLNSKNPLFEAVRFAIIGNVIDFGINEVVDFEEDIRNSFKKGIAINDYNLLERDLKLSKRILYIGDNSGEIVFDKLLISLIKEIYPDIDIIFACRSEPIINDVLIKDALQVGIDEYAKVISSGISLPGTILKYVNNEFMEELRKADLVIAKGQGNFEGLEEEKMEKIYFLLKAKCNVVANYLGCNIGDLIIKKGN
ncbi:unnamed protein product [marine sediment metagenome]|uniref:Damage-control phosphatase ARMT1-like metal-binding domain-containing protein n=1 Tax=marine sediment metagenome TaxID=412755 RepID=X0ZXC4_9ZZZZ